MSDKNLLMLGNSWTDFRAGLPHKDCYDLVFRHALDITGETLVFGTTTGNLFLPNDGEESWESLNSNLPMVYSLALV
jgi:hypothetical protein